MASLNLELSQLLDGKHFHPKNISAHCDDSKHVLFANVRIFQDFEKIYVR